MVQHNNALVYVIGSIPWPDGDPIHGVKIEDTKCAKLIRVIKLSL